MRILEVGIVDVFASQPLSGNPLAVVEGGEQDDDETLRLISREFNQAETTFIMPSSVADWKLRSFTAAGSEVHGAGHNALGAWLWLASKGALGDLERPTTFHQEIGGRVLPIVLERLEGRTHGRMQQAPLRLLPVFTDHAALVEALKLKLTDLVLRPGPRVADTGAAHLMVRLADRIAVDRAEPVGKELLPVLVAAQAEGCYIYAFDEAGGNSAYARCFNPTIGLWEDAATGTAAGPLAAYLASEGLITGDALVVEQGTRMGRQSFLHVAAGPVPELSGSGVIVMRGQIELPCEG
ncbi:PhzF family phenazine biosynthesis protein [Sphingomonas sp. UYAg733]